MTSKPALNLSTFSNSTVPFIASTKPGATPSRVARVVFSFRRPAASIVNTETSARALTARSRMSPGLESTYTAANPFALKVRPPRLKLTANWMRMPALPIKMSTKPVPWANPRKLTEPSI